MFNAAIYRRLFVTAFLCLLLLLRKQHWIPVNLVLQFKIELSGVTKWYITSFPQHLCQLFVSLQFGFTVQNWVEWSYKVVLYQFSATPLPTFCIITSSLSSSSTLSFVFQCHDLSFQSCAFCISEPITLNILQPHCCDHSVNSSSHSVNGDIAIQWKWSNFDHSYNPNPLTDYDKTLHNWLRPREEHVTQNLCQSAVRERLAKYMKYKASLFYFYFSIRTRLLK